MLAAHVPLQGRIESFSLDSEILRGNALRDPHRRPLTVYLPSEYDRQPDRQFPLFVDLVGFFSSGPVQVAWKSFDESVPERVERLVRAKEMGPVIVVFPDCWTRLGGNQYINSSATGHYADYLIREVVPAVEQRYRTYGDPGQRALFGKSSGGYGSMIHGMKYAKHWGAIACHSGDMGFDVCYRGDIPRVCNALAPHRGDYAKFVKAFYQKRKFGGDSSTLMFLAMAASYDPDPDALLGFHLPMDLHTGELDVRRWARWLRNDPIRLGRQQKVRERLASLKGVYIDCGNRDQFGLHFGARILHQLLERHGVPHHYEEFDDNHTAVDYRMDVSLPWLYEKISR